MWCSDRLCVRILHEHKHEERVRTPPKRRNREFHIEAGTKAMMSSLRMKAAGAGKRSGDGRECKLLKQESFQRRAKDAPIPAGRSRGEGAQAMAWNSLSFDKSPHGNTTSVSTSPETDPGTSDVFPFFKGALSLHGTPRSARLMAYLIGWQFGSQPPSQGGSVIFLCHTPAQYSTCIQQGGRLGDREFHHIVRVVDMLKWVSHRPCEGEFRPRRPCAEEQPALPASFGYIYIFLCAACTTSIDSIKT